MADFFNEMRLYPTSTAAILNDCFDTHGRRPHAPPLLADSMFKYMDMELYVPKAFMFT